MLVICRDTDVLLLLVHFIPAQTAEVWMIYGTAKKRKGYPIHALSESLTQPLRTTCWAFTRSQVTQPQCLVAMTSGLTGKRFRIIRILAVMEISHQLNNLYVTCTAHLSSQPSTMPDSNFSVRPILFWRCYPQPETPWDFTPHAPTIKQKSGCRQTMTIYTSLLPPTYLHGP